MPLTLLIAAPRGFCAGVDRAIEIVERAIERYGAPVYVRHEIVHNRYVVDALKAQGAVFVEELDEVPDGAPVVFSAHGVPKSVPAEATRREMVWVDATCPLVSKVHRQAERQIEAGRHILFVGHRGHPEVIGTMGQVPEGTITLVETVDDVAALDFAPDEPLAFLTQTTLSVDDTRAIVAALEAKFPQIVGPKAEDICYATSNRQAAVKVIAPGSDLVLVIGAPNSSNSLRLVEVATRMGTDARLIQRASDIDPAWLDGVGTVGLTAGASAPEALVREVVDRLSRVARGRGAHARHGRGEDGLQAAAPARRLDARRVAVYTHLAAEDLAALIGDYDVGELVSAKGIAEGISNSNWLVETTGTRGGAPLHPDDVRAAHRPRRPAVLPRPARPPLGRGLRGAAHDPRPRGRRLARGRRQGGGADRVPARRLARPADRRPRPSRSARRWRRCISPRAISALRAPTRSTPRTPRRRWRECGADALGDDRSGAAGRHRPRASRSATPGPRGLPALGLPHRPVSRQRADAAATGSAG